MKYKNPRNFACLSQVVLTAVCVTVMSPITCALAEHKLTNHPSQLLADNENNDTQAAVAVLPESVKNAIWQDISQRTNLETSALRIVKAERVTWPNGCLGLKGNEICSAALVPGWQVVVASQSQMWVYRTDSDGMLAKLDEQSTQIVNATMAKVQSATRLSSSRTVMQRQTMAVQQRSTYRRSAVGAARIERTTQISAADSMVAIGKKPGFTLAILQPSGGISEVITRISVKAKRGHGYLKERFLGDYKYKIKHKAKFIKGLKAGDRVVVRLYDLQNRFIGYSEFECMSGNTTVNLILPANAAEYKVVRTVYGLDTNLDGRIDSGATTYDYFTQVNGQRVTFLSSSVLREVKLSQFQVQGLPAVAASSVYPTSFSKGEFSTIGRSISISSADLAPALQASPGSLVSITEINDDDSSTYDVGQLMMDYREVGVARDIRVKFSDVYDNHWAKDFIAELAALQIIEGFPDGTFRPDEQLTRAQFAAMIAQAFKKIKVRPAVAFRDVSTAFWAYNAIQQAYQMGFFKTFGNEFRPNASMSRLEVLLGFAEGLNYNVSGSPETILAAYTDAGMIRNDVRNAIAALTERGIVVNYPDVETLNPEKVATRAEVCALLYKALVSTGEVPDIFSQYAVRQTQQAQFHQSSQMEESNSTQVERARIRRHCNQGIGNGAEGCDPGNSHPHGGSNDEGGRTPGGKR